MKRRDLKNFCIRSSKLAKKAGSEEIQFSNWDTDAIEQSVSLLEKVIENSLISIAKNREDTEAKDNLKQANRLLRGYVGGNLYK